MTSLTVAPGTASLMARRSYNVNVTASKTPVGGDGADATGAWDRGRRRGDRALTIWRWRPPRCGTAAGEDPAGDHRACRVVHAGKNPVTGPSGSCGCGPT